MVVVSTLPGQRPNQIVQNLFALNKIKGNGRSSVPKCYDFKALEEVFNKLGLKLVSRLD